jgi:16S rRNA G966 N2-methylase RsmD
MTNSNKLTVASQEIHQQLGDISQKLATQNDRSRFSIPNIAVLHSAPQSQIYSPYNDTDSDADAETDGEGYRCKCSFQLISSSQLKDGDCSEYPPCNDLLYSVREQGNIIPLRHGIFSAANRRIRRAMVKLMECLNAKQLNEVGRYKYYGVRNNLTSITFISSWGDGDCHVTLHYGPPGIFEASSSSCTSHNAKDPYNKLLWTEEAQQICHHCNITSLAARSKGVHIVVFNPKFSRDSNESVINDDLWITMRHHDGIPPQEILNVSLVPPTLEARDSSCQISSTKIQYKKSTEAFQHPNAGVMLTSLHWILNTLSQIAKESQAESPLAMQKPRMLEIYCGCGAHTIPIAKCGMLSEIMAVELDERLVTACRNNCSLNHCLKGESENANTKVSVVKGDAATLAKKMLKSHNKQNIVGDTKSHSNDSNQMNFDILLVDPPREGLDKSVCDLALCGNFHHVIYISCGRRALLRDLEILCMGGFDVVDLALIDLFPGTDAVESLVHLKRTIIKP